MKNGRTFKKGFTLVELLAVIVILAIILAIAIPSITTVVNNSSKSSFEIDAKMLLKSIEYKTMEDSSFNPSEIDESNVKEKLNIDDSNYQTLTVKKMNGKNYITIVGKNKWANLTVSGTAQVTNVTDTQTAFVRGANAPVLATNMKPIKWDGSTWIETTPSDTSWYNYDTVSKIWANARTADGSMWVWIPRYIYKISTGWHTNTVGTIGIQFTKGIDDNWNKASIGEINLDENANASNNTWTNHPAFTFDSTELTGIWVSKFEASNDGSNNAKFIPNVSAWRSISENDIFNKTRSMETNSAYGWGTTGTGIDTHMMKNTEWGAVAYLSKSSYGKNSEIWINNSNTYTTGCAANSASEASYAGCENTYNTTNGLQASTTGNIYGIYDMSGGVWEYTAAYVNNGHTNLTTYGNSIINADTKYKDIYTRGSTDTNANNYGLAINHKGDAIYETSANGSDSSSAWYSDYTVMTRTDSPWFARGGICDNSTSAGAFAFSRLNGSAISSRGFRSVVLVGAGL